MGIEQDFELKRKADEFIKEPPEERERLMYIAILKTDRTVKYMNENGCDAGCGNKVKDSALARWLPASIGTGIAAGIAYLINWAHRGGQ